MITINTSCQLCLRSPSHALHKIKLPEDYIVLRFNSAEQVRGQWLASVDSPSKRLVGVSSAAKMDRLGETLIFDIKMTDTGEEFVVFRHVLGVSIVCIQLSPPKCSVEQYHQYITSYSKILFPPSLGERSVAGASAVNIGREPSYSEASFRLIKRAALLAEKVKIARQEISKHPRRSGGESSIDASETLSAWKTHQRWYKSFERSSLLSPGPGAIYLANHIVLPLKAVRKQSNAFNLFTGAAIQAISSISRAIGGGSVGGIVASLLLPASRYLQRGDVPVQMTDAYAWTYLERFTHPDKSAELAQSLLEFRRSILRTDGHLAIIDGCTPFLLAPPEIVFQTFVTSKALLALGMPIDRLADALKMSRTSMGFTFNNFTVWADTAQHRLSGWRDRTSKPAAYEPDLVIVDNSECKVILMDAKFRRDPDGLLPSSGIKDMQAYMHEYGVGTAVIAVPSSANDVSSEVVQANGFAVRGIGVTPDISETSLSELLVELNQSWNHWVI